jgi:hypothetical protein
LVFYFIFELAYINNEKEFLCDDSTRFHYFSDHRNVITKVLV